MKKFYNLLYKAGVFVIVSLLVLTLFERFEEIESAKAVERVKRPATTVRTVTASLGEINQWVVSEGTVRAVRKEFLQFGKPGRVIMIGRDQDGSIIREGSNIKGPGMNGEKGDVLAKLDDREYIEVLNQLQVELAQAQSGVVIAKAEQLKASSELEFSRSNLDRLKKLYDNKILSKQNLDEAKNKERIAHATYKIELARIKHADKQIKNVLSRINQAKINIEHTRIYAPFDGVIAYFNLHKGDYISLDELVTGSEDKMLKTTPIVVIDTSAYRVLLKLPSIDGLKIKKGQHAIIFTDSFKTDNGDPVSIPAYVDSLSPAINPETRTIQVSLTTNQSKELFRDGAFVSAKIRVQEIQNTVVLPLKSIIFRDNEPYVFVVNQQNNSAEKRRLVLGIEDSNYVEVLKGVNQGDIVVTDGKRNLVDGEEVLIVDKEKHT